MKKVAFITGHLDLSSSEFELHYRQRISDLYNQGFSFVVGDARGCDTMAQDYLKRIGATCIVYHMFENPRNNPSNFMLMGGYKNDEERDLAMHEVSSITIGWVRSGREKSGTAKNLARIR